MIKQENNQDKLLKMHNDLENTCAIVVYKLAFYFVM